VAAVSGGALFPSLTGLLADKRGYHIAMLVPLCGFLVAFAFPIYLNTVCAKELDGFRETQIGYQDADGTIGDPAREERRASITWEEKGMNGATSHLEIETGGSMEGQRRR
jgi:FHS family L-fucose permease-like MFS transporter